MSRFDFVLKHVASKSMGQADSLSRRTDWAEKVKKDNENQVMLKSEWLEIRAMKKRQWLIKRAKEDIIEKIKKLKARDDEVIKAEVKVLRNKEWQIEDDLVSKEGKVYIPRNKKLRLEIIWLHHDMLIAEHGE